MVSVPGQKRTTLASQSQYGINQSMNQLTLGNVTALAHLLDQKQKQQQEHRLQARRNTSVLLLK